MGWCWHGYWPDMTPLTDVITLPALPSKSAEHASEVLWRVYEKFPAIQNEFKDVHVLQLWTGDPRFLITAKKQVKTLEDIKGMKIRTPGGPPTEQIKTLGPFPCSSPCPKSIRPWTRGSLTVWTSAGKEPPPTGSTKLRSIAPWRP